VKVAGFDPSSACFGVALVDGTDLVQTDVWRRPTRGTAPERLFACYSWLIAWLLLWTPDIVSIEFLSVERGAKTTRVISHYQAAGSLAAKAVGLPVIEGRVGQARAQVLGNGGLSKEDAFAAVREMFPRHRFGAFDKGGGDRSDAVVMALAGPSLAERS
jgi:Holliday junction resolvasome RuvABC endonuclease subunit